ncbi:type II secretion system F family protein [Schaalia canis]|uniref:Type II secretion system protein F n=1 Tax=Schaalia canis TaxID=100469 RepID=A0A3P1SDM6_9ACTO|nr:type II secretion system F family protein [Schaalia canis]RRC95238.1 type II secretion system protein F [Schaalia canis]
MEGVLIGLGVGVGLLLILSVVAGVPAVRLRSPQWFLRWQDRVQRANLEGLTVPRLVGVSVALSLVVFVVAFAWTGVGPVSLILAVVTAPLPNAFVSARAHKRSRQMREVWPEIIDSLVSGVRAGASLPDLLIDLGENGPPSMRGVFAAFAADYRAEGRFDPALVRLKERCADPVADRIVEALRLAREVGGSDLSLLLRDLATLLREDARVRGELEARQSWTVNAARLGVAAPWVVLLLISGQSHAAAAYATSEGLGILGFGAIVSAIAYAIMRRIGRLSTDQRSLR